MTTIVEYPNGISHDGWCFFHAGVIWVFSFTEKGQSCYAVYDFISFFTPLLLVMTMSSGFESV